MLNIAHRGASGKHPENTLLSFQKAIDLNVDMIEMDVRVSGCGTPVIIHDETVSRTTGGRGKVRNKNIASLKKLDAGNGQQIPTLSEALNLIDGRCGINLELASCGSGILTARSLEASHGIWDSIVVSSFLIKELIEFHAQLPRIRLSYLTDDLNLKDMEKISLLPFYSINMNKDFLNKFVVDWLHGLSFQVFSFTVNTKEERRLMGNWGVDGVFTDYPELFHK